MSLKDINCNEELPETTPTLEGNLYRKLKYVFENYGYNCFTDDTGLEIDALNGEPECTLLDTLVKSVWLRII